MSSTVTDKSGTFTIGEHTINRLGFGSMQLTGPGVWGPPADPAEAVRVLRRAVELGVNFIDTADSYGPVVAEQLIAEALYPYPENLVIATKGGLTRQGPRRWTPVGRPEYLRQQTELSLRNLKLDRIPLYQLHKVDEQVPLEDQVGELVALQREGKIGHIGLSNVDVTQLKQAQQVATIVTVQNLFNLTDRSAEPELDYCTANGIGFIPWFPLATGQLSGSNSPLTELATKHGVSASQLALAWLLRRSPVMLPIPGTSSVEHLEDNLAAAEIELSDDEFAELDRIVS
jgi:pyridoxine 4-dehydrogenase